MLKSLGNQWFTKLVAIFLSVRVDFLYIFAVGQIFIFCIKMIKKKDIKG